MAFIQKVAGEDEVRAISINNAFSLNDCRLVIMELEEDEG